MTGVVVTTVETAVRTMVAGSSAMAIGTRTIVNVHRCGIATMTDSVGITTIATVIAIEIGTPTATTTGTATAI
jgi:hypothetical protein